jgi:hypothetical protein
LELRALLLVLQDVDEEPENFKVNFNFLEILTFLTIKFKTAMYFATELLPFCTCFFSPICLI